MEDFVLVLLQRIQPLGICRVLVRIVRTQFRGHRAVFTGVSDVQRNAAVLKFRHGAIASLRLIVGGTGSIGLVHVFLH
jgi:hypothetical protein